MDRVPEPELMLEEAQVRAYANADFDIPHSRFIELLTDRLELSPAGGSAIDLGCGSGDITRRFVAAFPRWAVDAVDGSSTMLAVAAGMTPGDAPIRYLQVRLPAEAGSRYDLIFSNSLLHHLNDPQVLWSSVAARARPGSRVFIMDLLRPPDLATAEALQQQYAADEPAVLQQDFYNSLLAAYEPAEIHAQLHAAQLDLRVETVSDRHFIAWGRVN
jgi:trans-aconitate methyltransferase